MDTMFEMAVDAGADDVNEEDGEIEIIGPVEVFKAIGDRLKGMGIVPEEAGLRMIPTQDMELNVEDTVSVLKTVEALEELDDVQNVFYNLRISDEAMAAMEEL